MSFFFETRKTFFEQAVGSWDDIKAILRCQDGQDRGIWDQVRSRKAQWTKSMERGLSILAKSNVLEPLAYAKSPLSLRRRLGCPSERSPVHSVHSRPREARMRRWSELQRSSLPSSWSQRQRSVSWGLRQTTEISPGYEQAWKRPIVMSAFRISRNTVCCPWSLKMCAKLLLAAVVSAICCYAATAQPVLAGSPVSGKMVPSIPWKSLQKL